LNRLDVEKPLAKAGKSWLLSQKGSSGWQGEPILEYWFEEKEQRTMYFSRDNGRITSAWASLAVHSDSCQEDI